MHTQTRANKTETNTKTTKKETPSRTKQTHETHTHLHRLAHVVLVEVYGWGKVVLDAVNQYMRVLLDDGGHPALGRLQPHSKPRQLRLEGVFQARPKYLRVGRGCGRGQQGEVAVLKS